MDRLLEGESEIPFYYTNRQDPLTPPTSRPLKLAAIVAVVGQTLFFTEVSRLYRSPLPLNRKSPTFREGVSSR
jgi:hypothetical protein